MPKMYFQIIQQSLSLPPHHAHTQRMRENYYVTTVRTVDSRREYGSYLVCLNVTPVVMKVKKYNVPL